MESRPVVLAPTLVTPDDEIRTLRRGLTLLPRAPLSAAGFTLIELLIVITILGILAAVVVFAVGGVGDRGRAAACASDRTTLNTAEQVAFVRTGGFVTESELVADGFLREESVYYDIVVDHPVGDYSLLGASGCSDSSGGAAEAGVPSTTAPPSTTVAPSTTTTTHPPVTTTTTHPPSTTTTTRPRHHH